MIPVSSPGLDRRLVAIFFRATGLFAATFFCTDFFLVTAADFLMAVFFFTERFVVFFFVFLGDAMIHAVYHCFLSGFSWRHSFPTISRAPRQKVRYDHAH